MLGAAKKRQETNPPADARELADLVVRDLDGNDVRLADLWAERPGVLVFLRHYGWTFCRDHAVQLHRDRDRFEEAGVRLAVIGQGTPEQARHFQESQGVDLELYVDEKRAAYKAAGAKKATFGELLGPRMVARGMRRSAASGVRQGRTVGHPAQLGGVLIVMPDGSIPYTHLADDASDNPPNDEVLNAIEQALSS